MLENIKIKNIRYNDSFPAVITSNEDERLKTFSNIVQIVKQMETKNQGQRVRQ